MNKYWKNYLNHIEYINQIRYDDGTNIIYRNPDKQTINSNNNNNNDEYDNDDNLLSSKSKSPPPKYKKNKNKNKNKYKKKLSESEKEQFAFGDSLDQLCAGLDNREYIKNKSKNNYSFIS